MSVTQPIDSIGKSARRINNGAGRFYQPELDALRFLAFMLVFFRHVIAGFGLARQHQAAVGTAAVAARLPSAPSHLSPVWQTTQSLAQCCDFGVCLFFFLSS